MLRAFLLDDEELAVVRLARMLRETGRVEVAGSSTDPLTAIETVRRADPDLLFLDIEMPGANGFEFLAALGEPQPLVIFTTAYNEYALQAFSVNSIDYLLKPVEPDRLGRALDKIEKMRGVAEARPAWGPLLEKLAQEFRPGYPERIASKTGDKIEFIDLERVTHLFAKDKLTFAATEQKEHCVDATIAELEQRLDPRRFVRIHRSTIVNLNYVHELHAWFAGRGLLKLRDARKTELTVARDRIQTLKQKLGVL